MSRTHRTADLFSRLASNWPAKALSLIAALILYLVVGFNALEERYLTVPVQLDLPAELVPGESYSPYVRVYLRGEADDIFSLTEDDIQVTADFSSYGRPGIFQTALSYRRLGRAENMEPLEVGLEPGMMTLTLEERIELELEVVPRLSGSPEPGFELASYSLIPPRVRVYGPASVMNELQEIRTETIELGSQSSSFVSRVPLLHPHPLIRFSDAALVEFRAEITESILVSTFDGIPISLVNLPSGLRALLPEIRGSIRAQASQSLINQTDPESISLVADASSVIGPGSYRLPVRPVVPRGFVVFRFDPTELEIEVLAGSGGQDDSGDSR